MTRKLHLTVLEHADGVSISCPELPGCHSQGATVEEAKQNIRAAIKDYLELWGEPSVRCEIIELDFALA